MALTRTNRGTATAASDAVTSSSFTPSNSSLLVAIVMIQDNGTGGTSADIAVTDSLGTLTWTSRVTGDRDAFGGFAPHARIFTTPITTGASMTVSTDLVSRTGQAVCLVLCDYTGYDTGSPTGATASASIGANQDVDGAQSITLSGSPASTSEILAALCAGVDGSGTVAALEGSGYTEIADLCVADNGGMEVQARAAGSTSTSVDWQDVMTGTATGNYDLFGIAIEVKEAGGAAAYIPPAITITRQAVNRATLN